MHYSSKEDEVQFGMTQVKSYGPIIQFIALFFTFEADTKAHVSPHLGLGKRIQRMRHAVLRRSLRNVIHDFPAHPIWPSAARKAG